MNCYYIESDDGTFFMDGKFGSEEPEFFNSFNEALQVSSAAVKLHPHATTIRAYEFSHGDLAE